MEIKLELEFRFPDCIGSVEEALEYLQYELDFGMCSCSEDNPFYIDKCKSKGKPYYIHDFDVCEVINY